MSSNDPYPGMSDYLAGILSALERIATAIETLASNSEAKGIRGAKFPTALLTSSASQGIGRYYRKTQDRELPVTGFTCQDILDMSSEKMLAEVEGFEEIHAIEISDLLSNLGFHGWHEGYKK